MTIFAYALLRAACQRMTDEELELARRMAQLAEEGNHSAAEALRKMVHEVLCMRSPMAPLVVHTAGGE